MISVAFTMFLLSALFFSFEGALVNADQTASTTPTSTLNFDVTLTVTGEMSLTCTSSVAMSAISGLTGGTSISPTDCNVKTNNANGYLLYVKASSTPAMVNNASTSIYFDDYRTSTPEYTWTNSSASSSFGISVSSTDVVVAFKNTGAACGSGSISSYLNCFRSLATSNINIASKSSPTAYDGVTSTIAFKAEIGSTRNQPTGSYTAGITVTAVNQ